MSDSLASSGNAPGGLGKIGIYSNAIDASNLHLKASGTSRNKRVQQLSGSDSDGAGAANITSPAHSSASSKMPRSSISSPTCALHHAAHLVSAVQIPTRYPRRPRVEGLDRGATRHLLIPRSRVPPLGREAIITIAHQYPLWALATALSTHA